jgi:TnpA family transposase
MPRRRALAGARLAGLLALPAAEPDLVRYWTLSGTDLAAAGRRRRDRNRLGYALQLCALRYPGRLPRPGEPIPAEALRFVADQVGVVPAAFAAYSARTQTRHQQLDAIRVAYGFGHLTPARRREIGPWLLPVGICCINLL